MPFAVVRDRQPGDQETVQAITLEKPLKYFDGAFR